MERKDSVKIGGSGCDANDDVSGREMRPAPHEESASRDDWRGGLASVLDRRHAFDHDAIGGYDVAGSAQHEVTGLESRGKDELKSELVNRTVVVRSRRIEQANVSRHRHRQRGVTGDMPADALIECSVDRIRVA